VDKPQQQKDQTYLDYHFYTWLSPEKQLNKLSASQTNLTIHQVETKKVTTITVWVPDLLQFLWLKITKRAKSKFKEMQIIKTPQESHKISVFYEKKEENEGQILF